MDLKRRLALATTLAAALTLSLPLAASADQGGDDPISGIDIIIKQDPSSQPIRNLTLSDRQLDKLGQMKGKDGARYMAEIIVKHIAGGGGGGKVAMGDIMAAFLDYGCPPMPWSHCGMDINVKGAEAVYTIKLKSKPSKKAYQKD